MGLRKATEIRDESEETGIYRLSDKIGFPNNFTCESSHAYLKERGAELSPVMIGDKRCMEFAVYVDKDSYYVCHWCDRFQRGVTHIQAHDMDAKRANSRESVREMSDLLKELVRLVSNGATVVEVVDATHNRPKDAPEKGWPP
jgi:hypothetical protein